jgi:DNA-binding GntR family transcriptional regulator
MIADHREFLAGLLARDLDGALRTLERHLAHTKAMIMDALREADWSADRAALHH